jgi:hypothetical protein
MAKTMPNGLSITADWERLDVGTSEERACFAAVGIQWNTISLTEGSDSFVNRVRSAPMVSAYHLAEWVAWNWWRLRWEPRSNSADWAFAHRLSTIGQGYVWPNITIFSDGERTALIAKPTRDRADVPFRYLSDTAAIVSASLFENAVDQFVEQVRGQLRAEGVNDTNLDRIWCDVCEERRAPDAAARRKLEALLGRDPDRGDASAIEQLVADAKAYGELAMNEIAADYGQGGELLTAETLLGIAKSSGFDASPRDAVRLAPGTGLPPAGGVAAWRLGAAAAKALRDQEHLGDTLITNNKLAKLSGVEARALERGPKGPSISFAVDDGASTGRVVLRSKWATGRRFELARLLGERIVASPGGRLMSATRAYTYRQKMQRSFAAELLSPFEAVEDILAGDYSAENQQDAARHFQVSDLTIRTLLVNHGRLEREDIDEDIETVAA